MSSDVNETEAQYSVLVNNEEQYSLWPKGKAVPKGWQRVGPEGAKQDCLKYIEEVWTDMRPLSLRRKMDGTGSVQH